MLFLVVVVLLVLAIGLGLAVKFLVVAKDGDRTEGATVQNVLSATGLITALVVAFVISGASSSYSAARVAAKSEADAVDTLYESAEYAQMPFRQTIQAAALCYARAVAGPEWDTLAGGKNSPVPSNWTGKRPGGIRATLIDMGPSAPGFGLVQSADARRGDLRTERLTQATPTVPVAYFWFMVVLVALSLGGLAFSIPKAENRAQLVALGAVTLVFISVVYLVYNFDRPFSGLLAQKPTAIEATAQDIIEEYANAYDAPLPCDETGKPLSAPAPGASATTTVAPPASTTTTTNPRTTTTTSRTTTTRR